ncbi:Hypothetical protein Minf_0119 [Methylacidiphilum infernorum V4]|uniref:Uncharacterized protein n=1 Tax=Methylacidiphilum infernorum (isolate V4) TaxID=481448 RepID=B3DX39_METI4|nr:Hypothetical protein Minf_0119 [Methylacidiphilum infernorum V4]
MLTLVNREQVGFACNQHKGFTTGGEQSSKVCDLGCWPFLIIKSLGMRGYLFLSPSAFFKIQGKLARI